MGRHSIFEGHQIVLHSLLRHAPFRHFFKQHMVIMDPLPSGGNLHTLKQAVKAQRKSRIPGIIHRVKGTLFAGIMGDKYEIASILLFKIPADKRFLLRLQIVRVADEPAVFFTRKPFCFVKPDTGDFLSVREFDIQNGQLPAVFPFQKPHNVLQGPGFHIHNIFKTVNVAHFKIQGGIFIQMTLCVMLLCPEHRSGLKNPVKYAHHHLFIKLRALGEHRRPVEIIQAENICSALSAPGSDFRSVDFRKPLCDKEITKAPHNPILNTEFRPFPDIPQRDRTQIQAGFQGNIHFPLGNGNRHRLHRLRKNNHRPHPDFHTARSLFRSRQEA